MKLCVLFPGIGYTCDKPLLYYSARLARAAGYEVIPLRYSGFPEGAKGSGEKMRAAAAHALMQSEEQLEGLCREKYERILFIGKSIGTAACLEYAYLVKKVVFPIDILPVVKVLGASVIHCFFVLVLLVIAMIFGYPPSPAWIQLPYYSFALCFLILGLSYCFSAVVVFFRDLSQIIGIALQIGMWATPILWDIAVLSPQWQAVFRLNPLTYIVNGYRGALYGNAWFFQEPALTVYFWTVSTLVFLFGIWTFQRLKPHFADVL